MLRSKYAPSMPHCRPMMNTRPQITSVDDTIRMPAWRSVSPKYLKTRRFATSASTRAENLTISPNDSSQMRGYANGSSSIYLTIVVSAGCVANSTCVNT